MVHGARVHIAVGAVLVVLLVGSVGADPIEPNLIGLDFNFVYSTVTYDSSTGRLSGYGSAAAVTFEPVLGGTTYPVFNLSGGVGGSLSLLADFAHQGTDFDVDGYFTTSGVVGDLTLAGEIPALGIENMSGGLLAGEIIDLQMYGDAGTGAFAFNGYFRAIAGDLIAAGYLEVNDTFAMRSWLSSVSPSLVEDFDFSIDFTATTHEGEVGTVPEPATTALFALGVGLLALRRRRRPR